jgi:cell division inhibitor SepF
MKAFDNLCNLLGVQTGVEEEYSEPAVLPEKDNRQLDNVVPIRSGKGFNVVICKPECLEEAQALADHLKNRKQVVINFESTEPEIAQKIIDFLNGVVYALDGQSQQFGINNFLFVPSAVEIIMDNKRSMHKNELMQPEPW